MIRKLAFILFSALLLVGTGIPANAKSVGGQLQIIMEHDELKILNGEVILYPVGQPSGDDYLLLSEFGGGLVKKGDATSDVLAAWLSELSDKGGKPRILDADGIAYYSGLPEGLYLVKPNFSEDTQIQCSPFLITVPYNGSWNIGIVMSSGKILTESPKTGQHLSPLIGAMGIVLSALSLCLIIERFKGK